MDKISVNFGKLTVGEVVTDDFRTATIFRENGIDFCCGGKQSLEEACNDKGLEPSALFAKIEEVRMSPVNNSHNYKEWKLDFLCDYIVNTHHLFVKKSLPDLVFYTQKIATVHGDHHPELIQIAKLFLEVSNELIKHLKKEEEVLFPSIKEVLKHNSPELKMTIQSEIERMAGEHEFAGGTMDKINELSHQYNVPDDGCGTYQVAYKRLQEFEEDLHIHVHLENNIIYPKALNLTQ